MITEVAQRPSTPMADMLTWLESNSPFNLRGLGVAPYVHVEDRTYVLRAELPAGIEAGYAEPPATVMIPVTRAERRDPEVYTSVGDRLVVHGVHVDAPRERRRDPGSARRGRWPTVRRALVRQRP